MNSMSLSKKEEAYKVAIRTKLKSDWDLAKNLRNIVYKECKLAKDTFTKKIN